MKDRIEELTREIEFWQERSKIMRNEAPGLWEHYLIMIQYLLQLKTRLEAEFELGDY